eukprot:TRINITY_DN660_c0_g2_i3.p1 TRINITY_DN660_c0_g2~~TRINITY_DN660_c0_g2_i3.p1  ORF type:complete len:624 (+),score=111.34 TRINITY_DN660_c0_g2_i3:535-2406(+)
MIRAFQTGAQRWGGLRKLVERRHIRKLFSLITAPSSNFTTNTVKSLSSSTLLCRETKPQLLSRSSSGEREKADTNSNIQKPFPSLRWKLLGVVLGGAAGVYLLMSDDWDLNWSSAVPEKRPKIVVLGSGWAALSMIREIDTRYYDIVMVSPRNFFLFTPLLPSVTVGTIEARSVTEPVRKYCRRAGANITFYEASCSSVDVKNNKITCIANHDVEGGTNQFELEYDHLVVAVGAINNTFGTPGVYENCHFLKEIEDAVTIRHKIMDCFETARLPGVSKEDKERLLHFVVVGGGPNGVEFAAELRDFVYDNLVQWFPDLVPDVNITLLELADHILNTYDAKISEYTEKHFNKTNIEVQIKSAVTAVNERAVVIRKTDTNQIINIPFGLCVWSTGIGPSPLVNEVRNQLLQYQTNRRAILTDNKLLVKGVNNIYALGDCATIEQSRLLEKFTDFFKEADRNADGYLTVEDFNLLINTLTPKYPQLLEYGKKVQELFEEADTNKDQRLSLEEFKNILNKVDSKLKMLPATAQVASQQGTYLGKSFNLKAQQIEPSGFAYKHFGSFAYIGDETAVADFSNKIVFGGWGAWWLWRSIYLSKQVSWRNKMLVSFDWFKTIVFGRDITRN